MVPLSPAAPRLGRLVLMLTFFSSRRTLGTYLDCALVFRHVLGERARWHSILDTSVGVNLSKGRSGAATNFPLRVPKLFMNTGSDSGDELRSICRRAWSEDFNQEAT